MRSTRSLFAALPIVMLACVPQARASDAQQPPAQPPAAQQQAPAPERKFSTSVGMFINVIKADKIPAFEAFIKRLHEAMAKTDKENRRKQAAGWRVFKSTQPDPQTGNVVYLFFMDPTADADYTITRIMVDVFPREEVTTIYETIKDAWVTQSMLNLELLANFGAPPAGMSELDLTKLDPNK